MFDWFKKSPPPVLVSEPEPVKALPEVPVSFAIPAAGIPGLRKWVVNGSKVGIVSGIEPSAAFVQVDFVDSQGITISSEKVHPGNLRLAHRMEIPGPRRPTVEQGILLGYF